ncbi:hypothetical protein ACFL17_05865 [Pseudomonadota bacterium]
MAIISERSTLVKYIASIAIGFGLLSISSGGSVLFGDGATRELAGDYVPFVVWFNFLAGFVYLIAGVGLWTQKQWTIPLSIFITAATLVVLSLLLIHILKGESYEVRTVAAMIFRAIVWATIATFAYHKIKR